MNWYDQKPELRVELVDFGSHAEGVHLYDKVLPIDDPEPFEEVAEIEEPGDAGVDEVPIEAEESAEEQIEAAYQQGYQEGHIVGLNDVEAEVQKMGDSLAEMVAQVERLRTNASRLCLEIGKVVAERIVGDELATNPHRYASLVQGAVDDLLGFESMQLSVSEQMREHIDASMGTEEAPIAVVVDPALDNGSFQISSEAGDLHASLPQRIAALVSQLEETIISRPVDELNDEDFGES